MATALYNVNALMSMDQSIKHVLIVDMMSLSHFIPYDDLAGNASFSDAATAMVIGRREEPAEMFYEGYQDSSQVGCIRGPYNGVLHFLRSGEVEAYRTGCEKMLDCRMENVIERAKSLFDQAKIQPRDVKCNCFSQHVFGNIEILREGLNLEEQVIPYVGQEIGYTGPSSPFLALKSQLDEGRVQENDQIFMWTVATGVQHVMMLFKL